MKNNDPLWEAPESTSDSPQHLTVFCSSISIDLSQIVNFYVFLISITKFYISKSDKFA